LTRQNGTMAVVFIARRVDVKSGKATGDHPLVMTTVVSIAFLLVYSC
jgi:hypothetical protein